MKIKKEYLRIFYGSVMSVATTCLILTSIDINQILGISLGICTISYIAFDEDAEKRHF